MLGDIVIAVSILFVLWMTFELFIWCCCKVSSECSYEEETSFWSEDEYCDFETPEDDDGEECFD